MCSFFEETLKPQVFWTALAAVGTLVAVLIALFGPLLKELKRAKKIERLIAGEIERNIEIVKIMSEKQALKNPDGTTYYPKIAPEEISRIVKFGLWEEYKYKLADDRPEKYEKYHNINQHLHAISNIGEIKKSLRQMTFDEEVSSFIKKGKDELGKD